MPEEMTINQTVQFALEATAGTTPGGGANKKPGALKFQLDPDFAHTEYAPMGERFDTVSVPSMEKSKLTLASSPQTYDELDYVYTTLFGAATKTTPVGAQNARKKVWSPELSGVIAGSTLYVQQGSSTRARAVNYGRLAGATWAADRKTCTIAGDGYAQQIQDGVALTASPTKIGLHPVKPKSWKVYLDTLAANIGTTALARCFSMSLGYTGAYGDIWPMDRDEASFASDVNLKPSLALTLSVMNDSTLANWWTTARAGQKFYIRFESISDELVDNLQTLSVTGSPTGGTFTLTYKAQTTSAITFDSTGHHPTAAEVQTALEALSTIGVGNVVCSGGPLDSTAVVVKFKGALANDTTLMTHADSLTGGTSPALAIAATTIAYEEIIDVCAVPAPDAFKDDAGAWVQDFKFSVVSDPAWLAGNADGTAVIFTTINDQDTL